MSAFRGGRKCLGGGGANDRWRQMSGHGSSQINHITRAEASVVSSRDRSMPAAVRRSVGRSPDHPGPSPGPPRARGLCHGAGGGDAAPGGAMRRGVAASRRLPAAAAAVENNFEETHLKSDLNIAARHVTTGHARRSIYSRVARGDAARSPPLPWQLAVNRIASGGN